MGTLKIVVITLVAVVTLGLGYGGFSHASETDVGASQLAADAKERVNILVSPGVAGVVVGALLLVARRKT
jgi:hypothetical protein